MSRAETHLARPELSLLGAPLPRGLACATIDAGPHRCRFSLFLDVVTAIRESQRSPAVLYTLCGGDLGMYRCLPEKPRDPTLGHANNSTSWRDRMTLCNGTRVRRERAPRDAGLPRLSPSQVGQTLPTPTPAGIAGSIPLAPVGRLICAGSPRRLSANTDRTCPFADTALTFSRGAWQKVGLGLGIH